MSANHDLTSAIKHKAMSIGFSACGISKAESLDAEALRLKHWIAKGMHGTMDYMEKIPETRLDTRSILPNARSVISLLMTYCHEDIHPDRNNFRIARYACGKDYHYVIKRKLNMLTDWIKGLGDNISARGFVDTAPILEKAHARRGGLGWIGKNTLLLHPDMGSFVFISEVITNLELTYDEPQPDHCGTCQRCLQACPTGALIEPYTLDARRCISYLTIEYRGDLPDSLRSAFGSRIYGCDACQEVCPFNHHVAPPPDGEFLPLPHIRSMHPKQWSGLTFEEFEALFQESSIKRISYPMLKRNIHLVSRSDDQQTESDL